MKQLTIVLLGAMFFASTGHTKVTDNLPGLPVQPDSYFLDQWEAKNGQQPNSENQRAEYFFTGKPYESDLGGFLFKYRNYDPELNRWTSSDPSGFPDEINNSKYTPIPNFQCDLFGLIVIGIYGAGGHNTIGNSDLAAIGNSVGGIMYNRDQKSEIKDAIRNARELDPYEPVILFGYSRGAVAANDVAKQLRGEGVCIELLILIDPVMVPFDPILKIPGGIPLVHNFYQKNGGPFPGTAISNPGENYHNNNITSTSVDHNDIVGQVSSQVISLINANNVPRETPCE